MTAAQAPTQLPTHEKVTPQKINVDGDVQRPLDMARVERIVAAFNQAALGVVVLSHRADGTYHCIDGQHRVAAQMVIDDSVAMDALVWTGLTTAQEAAMFRLLNNARPVGVLDRFRVRVAEGDPKATSITNALASHGWMVQASKLDGAFAAVAAVEQVWDRAGDTASELVSTMIEMLTKAWGHNAHGVRGEIIAGLGAVLIRYRGEVDMAKLTHELSQYPGGALALIGRAKALKELRGGKVSDAMAEHMVSLVNKGRRLNRLAAWRED